MKTPVLRGAAISAGILILAACATSKTARQLASDDGGAILWEQKPTIEQPRDKHFVVDASAIVHSTAEKILAIATDYDSYVANKVPMVEEADLISRKDGEMIVWFHTNLADHDAKYYVRVTITRGSTPADGTTVAWDLAPAQPDWARETNKTVQLLSGYWKVAPSDANPADSHVKYHLEFEPHTWVPGAIVAIGVNGAFEDNANVLFELMSR